MTCPACQRELAEITTGGITLDVCHGGCGGIWFDAAELDKLNESEEADESFLIRVPVDASISVDDSKVRQCPRCDDRPDMKQVAIGGETDGIVIDNCGKCEGTWLDHGELAWVQDH